MKKTEYVEIPRLAGRVKVEIVGNEAVFTFRFREGVLNEPEKHRRKLR